VCDDAIHGNDEFPSGARSLSKMAAPARTTISFSIYGPIARGDLPGLCDRVCALLAASDATVAYCDVTGVGVDAVTVDALARLQLAARRRGCIVRLGSASRELLDLVAFMGLENVLPAAVSVVVERPS
jgi:ABC-type transporter Mla MlaB component